MATTCLDLPQNSSNHIEDYHGRISASIPFTWESQPGTPKHNFRKIEADHNDNLPPLTPPPCYSYSETTRKHARKYSKASLIYAIFPKHNKKKTRPPTSPSSSSSSSSSSSFYTSSLPLPQSYSVSSSTVLNSHRHGSRSSFGSSTYEEEHDYELPAPSFCACITVNRKASRRFRGLYASIIKVLVKRLWVNNWSLCIDLWQLLFVLIYLVVTCTDERFIYEYLVEVLILGWIKLIMLYYDYPSSLIFFFCKKLKRATILPSLVPFD